MTKYFDNIKRLMQTYNPAAHQNIKSLVLKSSDDKFQCDSWLFAVTIFATITHVSGKYFDND